VICQRGACPAAATFHVWFGVPQQYRRFCAEHAELYRREAAKPVYVTPIEAFVPAPEHADGLAVVLVHDTAAAAALLTAEDRCDRCGHRAYVACLTHDDGQLLLCGHHYREHEANLIQSAEIIHDCRSLLQATVR
jgi:hypothetical protein